MGHSANDDAAYSTQLCLFLFCLLNYKSVFFFYLPVLQSRLFYRLKPIDFCSFISGTSAVDCTLLLFSSPLPKVGLPANQGLLLLMLIFPIRLIHLFIFPFSFSFFLVILHYFCCPLADCLIIGTITASAVTGKVVPLMAVVRQK